MRFRVIGMCAALIGGTILGACSPVVRGGLPTPAVRTPRAVLIAGDSPPRKAIEQREFVANMDPANFRSCIIDQTGKTMTITMDTGMFSLLSPDDQALITNDLQRFWSATYRRHHTANTAPRSLVVVIRDLTGAAVASSS